MSSSTSNKPSFRRYFAWGSSAMRWSGFSVSDVFLVLSWWSSRYGCWLKSTPSQQQSAMLSCLLLGLSRTWTIVFSLTRWDGIESYLDDRIFIKSHIISSMTFARWTAALGIFLFGSESIEHGLDFGKGSHLEGCGNFLAFIGCRGCSWSGKFSQDFPTMIFIGSYEFFKTRNNLCHLSVDSSAISPHAVETSSSWVFVDSVWILWIWEEGRTIFPVLRWCKTWSEKHWSRKWICASVSSGQIRITSRRVRVASRSALRPGQLLRDN